MFTVTHYHGIGECPVVVLINHPYTGGIKANSVEELVDILSKKGEKVYFTADAEDNRINNLDNWHEGNINQYAQKLLNYLEDIVMPIM